MICKHILRRNDNQHLAVAGAENVFECEMAFALWSFPVSRSEQAAEPAVSLPIDRIGDHLETVDRDQPGADQKFDGAVLGLVIGAHHAGERVAVGNADGDVAERVGCFHHFLRMRGAAQEGEVGGHGKFGVRAHFPPPLWGRAGWGGERSSTIVDACVNLRCASLRKVKPLDPHPQPLPTRGRGVRASSKRV